MDLLVIIGAGIALGGVFWGILRWEANPLDEAIAQAAEWDSSQKKMKQALERQ